MLLLVFGAAASAAGLSGAMPWSFGGRLTRHEFLNITRKNFREVYNEKIAGKLDGHQVHPELARRTEAALGEQGIVVEAAFDRNGVLRAFGSRGRKHASGDLVYDAILLKGGHRPQIGMTTVRDIAAAVDYKPTPGSNVGRFRDAGFPVPTIIEP